MLALRTLSLIAAAALSLGAAACHGNVTMTGIGRPLDEPDPRRVVQISGAAANTCARRADGTVACWGEAFGAAPADIEGLSGAVAISVGGFSACALRRAANVTCLSLAHGDEAAGAPAEVPGTNNAVQVSVGAGHACVLRAGGDVVCWGSNFGGALGDGTLDDRDEPTPVIGIADAVEVAAGEFSTCARLADKTVRCWGRALEGQLGDGESEHPECTENESCSTVPVKVAGLTDALEISAGLNDVFARKANGQVAAWGWNFGGQLGDGTEESKDEPVVLAGLGTSRRIYAGYTRSCAIGAEGGLSCWGWFSTSPEEIHLTADGEVEGLEDIVDVTGGWYHLCALDRDGEVSCWGDNSWHQLGDGTTTARAEPAPVDGL